jgi:hypothetical protein
LPDGDSQKDAGEEEAEEDNNGEGSEGFGFKGIVGSATDGDYADRVFGTGASVAVSWRLVSVQVGMAAQCQGSASPSPLEQG